VKTDETRKKDREYQAEKRRLRLVDKTEEYRLWRKKNPGGASAHHIVNRLIKEKKLKRGSCCLCKQLRAYAHHENYNKPLDIIWLCASCHKKYHLGLVSIIIKKKGIKKMLDPKVSAEIERLLALDISALVESDILFLFARRSYLNEEQLAIYQPFFDKLPQPEQTRIDDESDEVILEVLKRGELDKLAVTLGLNPEDYANKDLLIGAIKEKQA